MKRAWFAFLIALVLAVAGPPARAEDSEVAVAMQAIERMRQADRAGNLSEAVYHGRRAIELMRAGKAIMPALVVAATHTQFGDLLLRLNKNAESLPHFRQAYQSAGEAGDKALRRHAAWLFVNASLDMGEGGSQETLDMAREALRIDRALGEGRDEKILEDLKLLAEVHLRRGEYPAALDVQRTFVDGLGQWIGADDPGLLPALDALAGLHWVLRDNAGALAVLDRAEAILARHPGVEFKRHIAIGIARARALQNDSRQSAAALERVIAAYASRPEQEIPAKERGQLADAHMMLGDIHFGERDWTAAAANFRATLREQLVAGDPSDISITLALFKLGQVAGEKGDNAARLRLYRRCIQLFANETGREYLQQYSSLAEALIDIAHPILIENKDEAALASVDRLRERLRSGRKEEK